MDEEFTDSDISIRQFNHLSDSDWRALQRYREQFAYTRKPQYVTPIELSKQREIDWTNEGTFNRWIAVSKEDLIIGSSSVHSVGQTLGSRDGLNLIFGNNAVLPEFRHRGIGTKLLALAVDQANRFSANRRLRFSSLDDEGSSFAEKRGFLRMRTAIESELDVRSKFNGTLNATDIGVPENLSGLKVQIWNVLPSREIVESMLPIYSIANHEGNYLGDKSRPRQVTHDELLSHYRAADGKGDVRYTGIIVHGEIEVVALSIWKWSPVLPAIASSVLTGVADRWRKKGLARHLRTAVVSQMLKETPGITTLVSQVWSGNEAMKECNKKSGFSPRFYFNIYDDVRISDRKICH